MQEIKVYHQDGLIYFDRFRITELMLLKSENDVNKYLVMIDIQSFDYPHSESMAKELEQRFDTKINNDFDYVWLKLEEFCTLGSIDELNGLTITAEDSDDKFLYFGWHVPLYNNSIQFTKSTTRYLLHWSATSDDVNYYDERAKENKVEITCELNVFVFNNKEEYQKHEKLKSKKTETYFSVLRSLSGHAIQGKDTFDVSDILSRNLTKPELNEYAWQFAIEYNTQ